MDRRLALQGFAAASLAAVAGRALAAEPALTPRSVADAWLASLAPIEMAAARRRMLDPSFVGQHAGKNAFAHSRMLATFKDRQITTPNNDTLYSSCWIDLTQGPMTLTVPDAGKRYLSVAIMDMYSNNNVILGARTPGGAAGTYTLVGPGQTAPGGRRTLRIATPHAWMLARTLVDGPRDLDAAHRVQDGLIAKGPAVADYPLFARRSDPWSDYFRSADALLASDPPATMAGFAGLRAMKARSASFDPAAFGGDAAVVEAGLALAKKEILDARGKQTFTQGWLYPQPNLGDFGDDFRYRGLIAVAGLAALTPPEAMYMRPAGDTGRATFMGDDTWKLALPAALPVNGFWSLTMYEATPDGQFFLTDNPLNRYAIGDRTPGLKTGPNGAVDLYIGRRDPGGERTSNWLPAPAKGAYAISLRCYLPKPELLDGRYRLPALVKV